MKDIVVGTYTGTGAAIDIELGFVPDYVRVFNITDGDAAWTWFNGMTAGTAIADASGPVTLGSNGITALSGSTTKADGFTVGTGLSESAKVFRYLALRNSN